MQNFKIIEKGNIFNSEIYLLETAFAVETIIFIFPDKYISKNVIIVWNSLLYGIDASFAASLDNLLQKIRICFI